MPVKLYIPEIGEIPISTWTFPGGERGVNIHDVLYVNIHDVLYNQYNPRPFVISAQFHGSDDILDILLLNDALRRTYPGCKVSLNIPYFPYARQDRQTTGRDSHSLYVVATLLNTCYFSEIRVCDPHSDVLEGLFLPGVLRIEPQHELAYSKIKLLLPDLESANTLLVAPDAGAVKKIHKLAALLKTPVLECSKARNPSTGEITGYRVPTFDIRKNPLIVVDDICDGGRTFIELAKEVRRVYNGKLTLYVTHGIFSKGFNELNQYYDQILFYNDLRKDDQKCSNPQL